MMSNQMSYQPLGLACTVLYETQATVCTNRSLLYDATENTNNDSKNLQILGGSIVVLQDTFNQEGQIQNTRNLKQLPIDLHIVMDIN